MSKKTVTVYGATGSAGVACVNEFIRQGLFNVRVLARQSGQTERSSSGLTKSEAQKQAQYAEWEALVRGENMGRMLTLAHFGFTPDGIPNIATAKCWYNPL